MVLVKSFATLLLIHLPALACRNEIYQLLVNLIPYRPVLSIMIHHVDWLCNMMLLMKPWCADHYRTSMQQFILDEMVVLGKRDVLHLSPVSCFHNRCSSVI